jgi:F0F1-type ATP synthase epsilon subunit
MDETIDWHQTSEPHATETELGILGDHADMLAKTDTGQVDTMANLTGRNLIDLIEASK